MTSKLEWACLATICAFGLVQPACGGDTEGTGGSDTTSTGGGTVSTGGMGAMPPTTSTGGGGSQPVIDCPAGGTTTVPTGTCDMLQQDCPVGQGCVPVSPTVGGSLETGCVPGNGLKEAAQNCSSNGECKPGLQCVFGKCSPPCCPGNDQPCEGGLCNVTDTDTYPGHTIRYCSYLPSCELFDDTACNNGQDGNCYPSPFGYSFCVPPVAPISGEGGSCQNLNNCETNMLCVNNTQTCRWACYLDGSNTTPGEGGCPAGQQCNDIGLGIPNIGICQPT